MAKDRLKDRILKFQATEEEVVTWYLRGVLEKNGGNQSEAKRVLDINRSTVRRRMEKLGLTASSKTELRVEDDSTSELPDPERDADRDDEREPDDREPASERGDDPRSRGPR